MHPLRLPYEILSDGNPLMAPRRARWPTGCARTARPQPPTIRSCLQENASRQIIAGARCLARDARQSRRMDVPLDLRLAGAAGGPRHRSCGHAPLRKAGRESAASRTGARPASPSLKSRMPDRRPARMCSPRRCSMSAWHAAAVDARAFEAIRRMRQDSPTALRADACRIQGDGARPVLHAADRPAKRRLPPFRRCFRPTRICAARHSPRSRRCSARPAKSPAKWQHGWRGSPSCSRPIRSPAPEGDRAAAVSSIDIAKDSKLTAARSANLQWRFHE